MSSFHSRVSVERKATQITVLPHPYSVSTVPMKVPRPSHLTVLAWPLILPGQLHGPSPAWPVPTAPPSCSSILPFPAITPLLDGHTHGSAVDTVQEGGPPPVSPGTRCSPQVSTHLPSVGQGCCWLFFGVRLISYTAKVTADYLQV